MRMSEDRFQAIVGGVIFTISAVLGMKAGPVYGALPLLGLLLVGYRMTYNDKDNDKDND